MRALRGCSYTLCTILILFGGSVAHADPMNLFGGGPMGIALGPGQTAWTEDGMATYFNPAGLAVGGSDGRVSIQLNYLYEDPDLYIQRAQHSAATLAAIPTGAPVANGFESGAVRVPLGGIIKNKASIGVFFVAPQDSILSTQSLEPADPQWARFGSEFDRLTVGVALGVRPIPQLALGLGVDVFASFAGSNSFSVNIANHELQNRDLTFSLKTATAPVAGITIIPTPRWRIGLSYRGALDLGISLPDSVNIPGIGTLDIGASGSLLYSPHTISAGVKYLVTDNFSVGIDLRYELWKLAPPPDFDVSISTPGSTSLLSSLGIASSTVQPTIPFQNTLTPSAMAEYSLLKHLITIRGSYQYRPSYEPGPGYYPTTAGQPSSEADYLDANTHILGLGATFHVPDRTHLFPRGIDFDAGVQAQILPRSTSTPASETDPVGPLAWGGTVIVGGAGLHFEY